MTLRAAMTVHADGITVDFAGTSGLSRRGINVPAPYTRAYSCFGIKVVVAPDVPNNWASLDPFKMDIPGDCILNAPHPYPVSARNATGQLLPDLMMGCLHQIVPERVAAEGSSTLWNTPMRGGSAVSGQAEAGQAVLPDFEIITFHSGGTGARRTLDGLDGTAFPVWRPHRACGSDRECRRRSSSGARRSGRIPAGRDARAAASDRSWRLPARTTWSSPAMPFSIA